LVDLVEEVCESFILALACEVTIRLENGLRITSSKKSRGLFSGSAGARSSGLSTRLRWDFWLSSVEVEKQICQALTQMSRERAGGVESYAAKTMYVCLKDIISAASAYLGRRCVSGDAAMT
jgi:hypothetical protein